MLYLCSTHEAKTTKLDSLETSLCTCAVHNRNPIEAPAVLIGLKEYIQKIQFNNSTKPFKWTIRTGY